MSFRVFREIRVRNLLFSFRFSVFLRSPATSGLSCDSGLFCSFCGSSAVSAAQNRSLDRYASVFDLRLHETFPAVDLAKFRFFDLSGRITRDLGKNDFFRPFVTRKSSTELSDLLFCRLKTGLQFNDRASDLAKTGIRQSDDGRVFDGAVLSEEIFDLDRVDIFTAGDDDVLLSVYKVDELKLSGRFFLPEVFRSQNKAVAESTAANK